MGNNARIYWAIEQVGLRPNSTGGPFNAMHGVQGCGSTTNFNLAQTFELGQISIYANIEGVVDVNFTVSKLLDGYPLLYHRATQTALTPTLAGRSTEKSDIVLSIFPDTNTSATGGVGISEVLGSGMFVGSLNYRFDVDGFGTEELTLIGNNKVCSNDPDILAFTAPAPQFTGAFPGTDAPVGAVGISRRQDIIYATAITSGDLNNMIADPDCTILPPDVFGITASGVNLATSVGYNAHVQSIVFSVDLNRTALNELGRFGPYARVPNFPVEVNTEITVISSSGDMVSATESGILSTGTACGSFKGNLLQRTIRLATCEGTRIYTGLKNKLQSVNYTGGDTGGGNVEVTYGFRTYNDFTVMHSGDPNVNFTWAGRAAYLIN